MLGSLVIVCFLMVFFAAGWWLLIQGPSIGRVGDDAYYQDVTGSKTEVSDVSLRESPA